MKTTRSISVFLLAALLLVSLLAPGIPTAKALTEKVYGPNLVANGGSMDNILAEGETERTLNIDWAQSYPVATFGGAGADSPAKVRSVDGNNVLVLEYSTGGFASFFADLYAEGEKLPVGRYELSMDLFPAGTAFATDNVGFNLVGQYSDIRIYDGGWKNCTEKDGGWLHYAAEFDINADSVDSIQLWFNTMSAGPAASALYLDNLCIRTVTEEEIEEPADPIPVPAAPNAKENLVGGNGTLEGILAEGETERTLNIDWNVSYPVATFGGPEGDSPAKLRNLGDNTVLVLEHTTGAFASYFADLYAEGEKLPAGKYELSMDLRSMGGAFATDNIGFNLVGQYSDIRIYDGGWKDCTELENGWLHYAKTFEIAENSVDSIQMWFNTMGADPTQAALYIDNLCLRALKDETPEQPSEPEQPEKPTVNGPNLVHANGSFDGILSAGETERTLNADWNVSYPAATFGGSINGDSPAKIRNVDGNNVLVLEHSTGNFASFFADLYADGTTLPEGNYELRMDLKPIGTSFRTDNIGFNLYNQYQDIRIYDNGWRCTKGEDGWYHYSRVFSIQGGTVDSIQMWFNTMGLSPEECALYIDNLYFARTDAPATGDGAHAGVFLCLAAASVMGLCACTFILKKKEN